MIYKLDECIYLEKNKYTFKTELFWKDNMLIYWYVASKNGVVACLLQSLFTGFSKEEKNKAINDYFKGEIKELDYDYSELNCCSKELVKLTNYKVG